MNEYDLLLKEIDESINNLHESLGAGVAKDYAEYQNTCGKISGLLTVHRYIKDLQQHMENSDE